ncbi:class I SAM-dependent methyltransferase [Alkalilimnicola sp. S0819]|uniref:class I SAM-dependent methyltransferase n=1 Tax=Alkalilimnicola sp. S0819 TaxID=2613922 RepID=UPI001261F794|nr:class I SAM-dependent methyltransferase [Alkalilimnicola sp. S0819]KAB7627931.1 class I SAM-dependent methyltransferase [Alkalilimnicola sp. S0819]MPQ15568.1 class I SAM-dependent methyltransferase [Alkalilimnicola sp. S0819]
MFRDLIDDLDDYSAQPHLYLDVPYVPTDEDLVEEMLALAEVGARDLLYDLGSGDGRIVVAAARDRGAHGVGIELDPLRIADAMEYAGDSGVEYLVDFVEADIFSADISEASVVTLYLLDSVNVDLRPRLLSTLRPGTRIVSHAFDMGDWKADERRRFRGTNLFKWIVPAQVAGRWEWRSADGRQCRIELEQNYQQITARAWFDERPARVESAQLRGDRLKLLLLADDAAPLECFSLHFADGQLASVTAVSEIPAALAERPQ